MTPEERKELERKKAAHKAAKFGKTVELAPEELEESFEVVEQLAKPRRRKSK